MVRIVVARAVAVKVVVKLVKAVFGGGIVSWDLDGGFGEDGVVLEEDERMAEGELIVAMDGFGSLAWN